MDKPTEKRTKRLPLMLTEAEAEWLRERAFQEKTARTVLILEAVRAHYPEFPR